MVDAAVTGARVLAALERGRQRAIEAQRARAAPLWRDVRRALDDDILAGHPVRGRAGRIARKLRDRVSERHAKRILDALYSVSDSVRSTETPDENRTTTP